MILQRAYRQRQSHLFGAFHWVKLYFFGELDLCPRSMGDKGVRAGRERRMDRGSQTLSHILLVLRPRKLHTPCCGLVGNSGSDSVEDGLVWVRAGAEASGVNDGPHVRFAIGGPHGAIAVGCAYEGLKNPLWTSQEQ